MTESMSSKHASSDENHSVALPWWDNKNLETTRMYPDSIAASLFADILVEFDK